MAQLASWVCISDVIHRPILHQKGVAFQKPIVFLTVI